MSATDPVQAVMEVMGCARSTDRNGADYCAAHNFGWLRDVNACPRAERAAEAAVAAARPAIEREAKAEVSRLTHLLGSHADGHRCTCTMTDAGVYHGDNMHPPEWEQDPWCPTHPDVGYIKTEVAAREAAAWDAGHSWGWVNAQDAHDVRQDMARSEWPLCTPNPYARQEADDGRD